MCAKSRVPHAYVTRWPCSFIRRGSRLQVPPIILVTIIRVLHFTSFQRSTIISKLIGPPWNVVFGTRVLKAWNTVFGPRLLKRIFWATSLERLKCSFRSFSRTLQTSGEFTQLRRGWKKIQIKSALWNEFLALNSSSPDTVHNVHNYRLSHSSF